MPERLLLTGLAALLISTVSQAQHHKYDTWDKNYTVQALLGAVKFEDLKIDIEDSAEPETIDLSLLPQLGGAWTTLPKGERLQYGLECSFLLGFKFDKINYLSAGGSGLHVSISASLWMFDLAGGGYASLFLNENRTVRLYGGAGPLMTYADYRADTDRTDGTSEDTRESAFGVGLYARTGFEFRVHERGMLGLGARGTWSSVDFSNIGGNSELTGIAGFVTYTAGF
jgi:hypothetical protein